MNIIIRFFATLILLAPLLGQGQVIRGRVVNDLTREYISYVNIGVLKGERGAVVDDLGYFMLDVTGIAPGAVVRFSFIGYENHNVAISDINETCLEYIRELGEGKLQLKTGILSGKTYYRRTSQAEWHSIPLGLGMSVLIRYEK
ncbi:MAG: carboxypeptidase-like regulatory domain-containing protein [Candidatus Marinimicrobia bacterium]|nr:carboxypeptidase-like regulatory domain-containing protein [Candidatus Neomarinimicrobiota bacterium]